MALHCCLSLPSHSIFAYMYMYGAANGDNVVCQGVWIVATSLSTHIMPRHAQLLLGTYSQHFRRCLLGGNTLDWQPTWTGAYMVNIRWCVNTNCVPNGLHLNILYRVSFNITPCQKISMRGSKNLQCFHYLSWKSSILLLSKNFDLAWKITLYVDVTMQGNITLQRCWSMGTMFTMVCLLYHFAL